MGPVLASNLLGLAMDFGSWKPAALLPDDRLGLDSGEWILVAAAQASKATSRVGHSLIAAPCA